MSFLWNRKFKSICFVNEVIKLAAKAKRQITWRVRHTDDGIEFSKLKPGVYLVGGHAAMGYP